MRVRRQREGISAHAVAGSHVVLLGLDAKTTEARKGLLGFAIERTDHTENERYWLTGYKTFKETAPDPKPGQHFSTLEHPVQSFLWSDYTAKPAHKYTYRVRPVRGKPGELKYGRDVVVNIGTEVESDGTHAIYFNRGAIASQAYANKFGNRKPDDTEDPAAARAWLSRGLQEAALDFIAQAKGPRFKIRAALYEFSYTPFLEAFKAAAARGADVRIVYEAGQEANTGKLTSTAKANNKAIAELGIEDLVIKRTKRKAIPHNKFIVLLDGETPIEVWTGSTNFTESGFLGQSNVGHLVRDKGVAKTFHDYWVQLSGDPEFQTLRTWVEANTPQPGAELGEKSMTCIFSPRFFAKMLDWYAEELGEARQTVMFTAAFGVNKKLAEQFAVEKDFLRFIITEKPLSAESKELLGKDRDLKIASGTTLGRDAKQNKIPGWELDRWYTEELYRKTGHVFYVHTKYLLIDALTDDPLVFSGSANFSSNSLLNNDENMLLIRGEKRVADIYLTEFDRLFRHFFFRDVANTLAKQERTDAEKTTFLAPDDSWTKSHFKSGTFHFRRRQLFG